MQPFYDPSKNFEANFYDGPFGALASPQKFNTTVSPQFDFLGHKLNLPFGIASGPLLNSRFVAAAFKIGFDVATYKNVRTRRHLCHPMPNVLPFAPSPLTPDNLDQSFKPATDYENPLSILNSCGIPSFDPDFWQADLQKAIRSAGPGQVIIAGIQGTERGEGLLKYIEDHATLAKLVNSVNPPLVELNMSCPNEGHTNFLCFDLDQALFIVETVKNQLGNTPLILKVSYYKDDLLLEKFVRQIAPLVQGIAAINSIQVKTVGNVFPGRELVGVSGRPIKWAGIDMVQRLVKLRQKMKLTFKIIGIGGVLSPQDYEDYRAIGADLVESATGAMWNPHLAQEIKVNLHE